MVESVMEEEDIEECIKKVNAIDNGVMLFAQNMSQKFESIKNLKKKYVDKLVDYKVFIGGDPSKEEKEKNFRDVEALARDFKNAIKSIWTFDEGSKRFIETIDKENESLMGQINSYKNTLKDIEKYIKNNPKKKEESKKDDNKDEKKDETKKDEEEKKDETKKEEKKKEEDKKEEDKKEETKKEEEKKEDKKEEKKEETEKEEPKKLDVKKVETKKEEFKKIEAKAPEPVKEEPKKEEIPRADVRFMSNIPLYLGSILPQEPSYVISHPERKEELLIGFKTGSCALAQLKDKNLAVSPEFPLKMGEIVSIMVSQGKLCNSFYFVCAQQKKSVSMVYPTVEKDVLSLNQMLLTKMEDEYNNLMEVGIKSRVILTEFYKRDICAYCKNCIFLWKEANERFELNRITVEDDIQSIIQVGDNKVLALLAGKNLFIEINLDNLEYTKIYISEKFNMSLREDASLIQINDKYFMINNGIKFDLFKFEGELKFVKSFGKNASLIEDYRKVNDDTLLLLEYFDEKRLFNKYKFTVDEGEEKLEQVGGPYMFDVAQRLQHFCLLGEELLVVVEKGTRKIYIFKIS